MIFLCFSSQDRYTAVKSCLYHLKTYGYQTWYDYHELILGDFKREKNYINAIKSSDYIIMIYSKGFFESPCALEEEQAIFAEEKLRPLPIFPLLYNITFSELPATTQARLENRIYANITDDSGCLAAVNQIVTKILLDEMGISQHEMTPSITSATAVYAQDPYISLVLEEYRKIRSDNFNARISMLFCLYLYIKKAYPVPSVPEHLSRTIEYLAHYTNLDIPYNHKELIIAELVILRLLHELHILVDDI